MKLIVFLSLFIILYSKSQSQALDSERISHLKSSVVRILIENQPSGTGFIVTKDGWIATCWHVIAPAIYSDSIPGHINLKKMFAEFSDGRKVEIQIATLLLQEKYLNASVYDYAFLKLMDSTNQYYPLRIGQFEDAKEGDEIYSCGYPLGISQQFISKGILSTKWIQTGVWQQSGKQDSITKKDVAWLDLTMNRGNSGGPIIKVGTTSSDDEVVGIADFILNPFAQSSDELLNYLNSLKGGSVSIDGIDFAKMTKLFASAISDNSIGVSGCISIDYLKALLIPTNH